MVKKYKVVYERDGCIGAAACEAISPKYWEMKDDAKADLKGSKNTGNNIFELEIDEKDYQEVLESAQACPVNVIHIYDLKTGEKLI